MKLDYFYNGKGNYTITLNGDPLATCKNKKSAEKLIGICRPQPVKTEMFYKIPTLYLEQKGFDNAEKKIAILLTTVGGF